LQAAAFLTTPYPTFLHQVGEHDDAAAVLLPDHAPEVVGGVGQRTLSRNVAKLILVALTDKQQTSNKQTNKKTKINCYDETFSCNLNHYMRSLIQGYHC